MVNAIFGGLKVNCKAFKILIGTLNIYSELNKSYALVIQIFSQTFRKIAQLLL
jgi:hypothetical protein